MVSPSHEPSQDAIYDSLPPMEQSTVPESPLKDLLPKSPLKDLLPESPFERFASRRQLFLNHQIHLSRRPMTSRLIRSFIVLHDPGKDEMRKDGTRNEGMRNEGHDIPSFIEDPISDPRI
ncbi:hypothetical protein TNCV_2560241 [Trichonephila clavipes]|uniref:Uncharacterized protein n=1 Tax=Trichonephila clavipes TaxID=2585209 RepID=A0A8X6RAN0_TRICX|nr:hypothetical protein TNCV_2560241 [Trichonephila clavipes]